MPDSTTSLKADSCPTEPAGLHPRNTSRGGLVKRKKEANSGRLMIACAAIRGVLSGAARAVVQWALEQMAR